MSRNIEIVCHRGANEYAPENTYASAALCIDWQMDYLEIDVNTSRDGIMYVFHGPDLSRTTDGNGKIYELDSHEVDALDCGRWFGESFAGERIPRLEQFLSWIDNRIMLFFDVKYADLGQLVELIHSFDLQDKCFFWFGRDKHARAFHQLAPELALKINVTSPAEVAQVKRKYGAAIVEFALADTSDSMLDACRKENVRSMILQRPFDPEAYQTICDWGVDMVNVDHADRFDELVTTSEQARR